MILLAANGKHLIIALLGLAFSSFLVFSSANAVNKDLLTLMRIRDSLPVELTLQAELEEGRVDSRTIDKFEATVGKPAAAHLLLNWANALWKKGDERRTALEALLDEIARRGLGAFFSSAETYHAAFLWTDSTLAQRELTPEQRISHLDKALAFAPDYPDALALKGLSLAALGQSNAGRSMLARALDLASQSENEGLIQIGQYYLGDSADPARAGEAWILGRSAEFYLYYENDEGLAERALRESLALHWDNEWAQDMMADLLIREGRCSEALSYARFSVAASKGRLAFQRRLGDAYWCLGDRNRAIEIYMNIIDRDPSYYDSVRDRLR